MRGRRAFGALNRLGGLYAPRSPLPLALLRVAVCLIILISPEPQRAQQLAEGPAELWLAPPGVRWLLPFFSAVAPHLWLFRRVLQASALLALLGLWTRLSLAVLALTFVITFGGAQLSGAVLADMHLLWFVMILLVTPSGRALSLDAWSNGEPLVHAAPSSAAALGTRFARLLLGLVYFFPGVHKLLDAGLAWASSSNLQRQLWLKWFQAGGVVPWPRVDHWPLTLEVGGAAVLIFELGFVFGACSPRRRHRALAASTGLSFHALTQAFMLIPFSSLWGCYLVLLDGPPRMPAESSALTPASRAACGEGRTVPWPVLLVGLGLTIAVVLQGVRGQTQAWPFACYPTFASLAPDTIADLALDLESTDGRHQTLRIGPLPPHGGRPPRAWSTVWELGGAYGNPVSPARLAAFARDLVRHEPAAGARPVSARFYAEAYATRPEAYGAPPLSRRLIHTFRWHDVEPEAP
jgi:hypothetical protein